MEAEVPAIVQGQNQDEVQSSIEETSKNNKNSGAITFLFFSIALITFIPMFWLLMFEGLITEGMKLFNVIPVTTLLFFGIVLSIAIGLILGNVKKDFKWFFLPHSLIVIFMLLLLSIFRLLH